MNKVRNKLSKILFSSGDLVLDILRVENQFSCFHSEDIYQKKSDDRISSPSIKVSYILV